MNKKAEIYKILSDLDDQREAAYKIAAGFFKDSKSKKFYELADKIQEAIDICIELEKNEEPKTDWSLLDPNNL